MNFLFFIIFGGCSLVNFLLLLEVDGSPGMTFPFLLGLHETVPKSSDFPLVHGNIVGSTVLSPFLKWQLQILWLKFASFPSDLLKTQNN